jgi:hypothetical protein
VKTSAVAAVGLSLSLVAGACSEKGSQELSPSTTTIEAPSTTTTTTPEVKFPYQPTDAGHFVMRLVDVRDQSSSSAANAGEGDELLQVYHFASERIERSTLGELTMAFTNPIVVELPQDASAVLCDTKENGTEEEWQDALDLVTEAARDLADQQSSSEHYDGTVFDWRLEVCQPDVSGQASQGGDVHVFDANTGPIEHEAGGHFLGLGHSDSQRVLADGAPKEILDYSRAVAHEYGDLSTALGTVGVDRDIYNGFHLAGLGVLKPEQIEEVTTSGVYELDALLEEIKGDGTKLLRIPADGHWLQRQIEGGWREEGDTAEYKDESQEFYYIELSGRSRPPKELKPVCLSLSRRDFERDPTCNPNDVTIKVIRAGHYAGSNNPHPHTILVDVNPDDTERGIGQEDLGQSFVFDDIQLELLDIENSETHDATGSASLLVTLPG